MENKINSYLKLKENINKIKNERFTKCYTNIISPLVRSGININEIKKISIDDSEEQKSYYVTIAIDKITVQSKYNSYSIEDLTEREFSLIYVYLHKLANDMIDNLISKDNREYNHLISK